MKSPPWIAAAAIAAAMLSLVGCASVAMSDRQTAACRSEGCAAFTEAEILNVMGRSYSAGYLEGWKDANKQAGRAL